MIEPASPGPEEDSEVVDATLTDQLRRKVLSNITRISQSRIFMNYDEDSEATEYAREDVTQGVGDAAGQLAQVTVTDETSMGIPSRRVEATLFVVQDPGKLRDDVTEALVTAQETSARVKHTIGLKWQTPPVPDRKTPRMGDTRRNKGQHAQVALKLRKHPGRWALVIEGAPESIRGTSGLIRNARYACYEPAGSFEAISVKRDGVFDIYVRYVGEEA